MRQMGARAEASLRPKKNTRVPLPAAGRNSREGRAAAGSGGRRQEAEGSPHLFLALIRSFCASLSSFLPPAPRPLRGADVGAASPLLVGAASP